MPIDDLLKTFDAEDAQAGRVALSHSALIAHNTQPDQYADNRKKAVKQGIHPLLATPATTPANDEDMRSLVADFHQLTGHTREFMKNPEHAKLAHDDHENMSLWEDLIKPTAKALPRVAAHTAAGFVAAPITELAALGKLIHTGSLSEAYKVLVEQQKLYDDYYLTTDAERKGAANVGLPTKIFTMAGQGWGGIAELASTGDIGKAADVVEGRSTGSSISVPIANVAGQAVAMFGLGEVGGTKYGRIISKAVNEHISKIVDTSNASKLKTRDADLFKSFTQKAEEKAKTKPVQMHVDKFESMLAEKGLRPEDVLTDPTEYYEARYEGGKVSIPVSDLAAMSKHVTPKKVKDMTVVGVPSLNEVEEKAKANKKMASATSGTSSTRATEGSDTSRPAAERPEIIRPAVKVGDEIKAGADGERHTDIVKDAPEKDRGFTLDGKEMMNREEGAKWLKDNRPDLYEKLPEDQKEALHSEGLWASQGIETPEQTTINMNLGIPVHQGVQAAMHIAGDIRGSKVGKTVEKLMTPGLDAAHGIINGVKSLVLPSAKSPEHLAAAEQLGAKLGKMHRNQEIAGDSLRPDDIAFKKMGVRDEKVDLTQNPGVKFMSDMSQGRKMTPKLERVADKINALFEDRLKQLEAAGAPMEQVRENYFPGVWTNESRKAFNQAIGGAIEAGKGKSNRMGAGYGQNLPLSEWDAVDKQYVRDRVKALMAGGKGSEKDGLAYLARSPFKGRESFRKGKVFDDIMTAVEFGLEPISTNPVEIAQLKLAEMDRSIMANSALQDWRASGDEKFLSVGQKVPEGWVKVNDKYGTVYGPRDMAGEDTYIGQPILGHRIVKEPVADILNNYLSSSMYNNKYFGTLYRGYMGTANALNQSQLGVGSFFHVGFTESEVVISGGANVLKDIYGVLNGTRTIAQAAKTAIRMPQEVIRTPMEGDAILKEWRNPGSSMNPKVRDVAKAAELAGGGFKMEQGLKTEQTAKMIQDWYSDHRVKAALRSPVAAIEMMAKPIMEYIVPRQKAGVFGHLAERIMEQNPGVPLEQLKPQFRQAWNRVDARLGQVRYDRLFMNNAAKNAVQGLVRAPGWSGGTIAEIGGSLKDAAGMLKEWADTGKLPAELPDRVAYTLSLMGTVTAVNGLLTYAFTGDKPNGTDFWAFRTGGTDEYGRPERFVLPTYQKDIFAYLEDPGKTLLAKTHPVISIMGDLIKNKDYYGVTIANEDDNAILKDIERGTYVLKQFEPFWMRGAQKESERGGGLMETLKSHPEKIFAPQIGIMPATSAYTLSPAEKMINKFIGQQIPEGGRTQDQADTSKARRQLVRALRNGETIQSLPDKMQEKLATLTDRQIKGIEKESELTPLQASFTHLSDPTLQKSIKVWGKMTDSERDEVKDIYETRINKYILSHDLEGDELDKLNERIDAAEERK